MMIRRSWEKHSEALSVCIICVIPVNDTEPVVNIIGSQIVVFQIIGVFPYIEIEQGAQAHRQRRILVGCCDNPKLSGCIDNEPCIA